MSKKLLVGLWHHVAAPSPLVLNPSTSSARRLFWPLISWLQAVHCGIRLCGRQQLHSDSWDSSERNGPTRVGLPPRRADQGDLRSVSSLAGRRDRSLSAKAGHAAEAKSTATRFCVASIVPFWVWSHITGVKELLWSLVPARTGQFDNVLYIIWMMEVVLQNTL